MSKLYSLLRPALMAMDAEYAHRLTIHGLQLGLGPKMDIADPVLKTTVFGKSFPTPLGLAAGFDKDAEVAGALLRMGFGFIELGTVTPQAQLGNPRPRIFRDVVQKSVINALGFPGRGLTSFVSNIQKFRRQNPDHPGVLGVNIGINKGTAVPLEDYKRGIDAVAPVADYIAVNISSPNTEGLRDLQAADQLEALLSGLDSPVPLLLKLSPDLDLAMRAAVAEISSRHAVAGLIIANTTLDRPACLAKGLSQRAGGLSGALLKARAQEALASFYQLTGGRVPLVGVGGISSGEDAYARIRAGASLVQIYTGLIYEGPSLVSKITSSLAQLLRRDGFDSVAAAVGSQHSALKKVGS